MAHQRDFDELSAAAGHEIAKRDAEIDRLQEAKRHFSALADAKGKENVALLAANLQMRTALVWVRSWAGKVSESQRVAGEALDAVEKAAQ